MEDEMIDKKVLTRIFVSVLAFAFLLPTNVYSGYSPLLKIISPTRFQALTHYPVSIEVQFYKNAMPGTFRAWLNGRNITQKFTLSQNGAVAQVGPEDGLRFREQNTQPHGQALNWLVIKANGKRMTLDIDDQFFFVIVAETENHQPLADAGSDMTAHVGDTVTLDGSGSADVDGDPLTYRWSLTTPQGSNAQLSDPNAEQPSFHVDVKGQYIGTLIVNDGKLSSDADQVTITAGNSPPVAHISVQPEGGVDVNTEVTLDGSSSSDLDNDALTYQWTLIRPPGSSAALMPDSSDPAKQRLVPDMSGDYLVRLVVNDGEANSEPETITISVLALVPEVVGQRQATAESAVIASGLSVGTVSTTYSATVAAGHVISQNPGAGASVLPGTKVDLVVSLGPAPVSVPPVVGLTQNAATTAITGAGLSVGGVTTEYSDTVANGSVISQNPAANTLVVPGTAVDLVISLGPHNGLPPDPSTVAPEVDPTVSTSLFASTQFLYTGADPIQTGVSPGTIQSKRVAVLRGLVISRDGTPLDGVTISIADHPEYGQTLSREDGMFDLAVNGGGMLTVAYAKDGYLTARRSLHIPWRNFVHVPDVALIARDANSTVVNLASTAPVQLARGSVVGDADGNRQATLFFFQGTTAQMIMPDGSLSPISTLSVRATEYTVGPNGPAAMPAQLPPTSGYTYAVELSVDEAIAAGAQQVTFSRPVSFCVENFIRMPVGTKVPTAYYDSERKAWVPVADGRVVKIVSITDGRADVDSTGDGNPDSALGLSDAERQQLATTYSEGQELWRLLLDHFSIVDGNYGVTPPLTASSPNGNAPQGGRDAVQDVPSKQGGWGSVDVENQVFSERYKLVGTSFSLTYQSDSVEGYQFGNTLHIQLTGATVPTELIRADLTITIAGRRILRQYDGLSLSANQSYDFTWDGKDVYGRNLVGEHPARVQIDYVYPAYYLVPAPENNSFGLPSGTLISSGFLAREREAKLSKVFQVMMGRRPGGDVGGWSIGAHHIYDPVEQVLYTGTGGRRSAANTTVNSLHRIAGVEESWGAEGDGGPATEALLNGSSGMAVAEDGSIYVADTWNHRIRKISPDGIITTVAGNGTQGFSDDGSPATDAMLNEPNDVDVGPDGSLYIADTGNNCIRRVSPEGIITTVAGDGTSGYGGDGGPAASAQLNFPRAVAVAPDGTFFIADSWNYRIRRVGPGGIITTYAGNGQSLSSGDGIPATEAGVANPQDVDVGPDGSVYIVDSLYYSGTIRRVDPAGIITTVAGGGGGTFGKALPAGSDNVFAADKRSLRSILSQLKSLFQPPNALAAGVIGSGDDNDGIPALEATLGDIQRVAVSGDGTLLIATSARIYKVDAVGIISKLAGGGETLEYTEGMAGDQLGNLGARGLALGPDGRIFVASETMILALTGVFPEYDGKGKLIPSSDGSLIYRFNEAGRHLETLNALTGTTLLSFGYDPNGRLISITDADSNITTIHRAISGDPTGITGPYGQITGMTLDDHGHLKTLTNPAYETVTMGYDLGGLLTSIEGPRTNTYTFGYDGQGLLTSMTDPLNHTATLTRTPLANGHEVSFTSAEGRTSIYRVENGASGSRTRTAVTPDGLANKTVINTDGSRSSTLRDGTVIDVVLGPDPRFGMLAPIVTRHRRTSPGGLETDTALTRTVDLSIPSITDTKTINGRAFTSVYNGPERIFTNTSAEGRISNRQTDNQGRTTAAQQEGLALRTFVYNGNGFLASAMQGTETEYRTNSYVYDTFGRLLNSTDPESRRTSFVYDSANRLTGLTVPGNLTLAYGYDSSGNRISVIPPKGVAHAFDFNGLDLLEAYTAPDIALLSEQTRYGYNRDRQLTSVIRPDGLTIQNVYDAAGRLSRITTPTDRIDWTYDANGRIDTVSTSATATTLTYGYDGSMLTSQSWSGAVSGTVSYVYNSDLQIASIAVNGPTGVLYAYDDDGWLMRAGDLIISRDNSNSHLVTGTSLGGVLHTFDYNGFGEITSSDVRYDSEQIYHCQYTRDKLRRITRKVETIGVVTTMYDYAYNETGWLIGVSENGAPVESFTYDDDGNRLTSGSTAAAYDAQDRLITYGTTTYTYTDNGELFTKTDGTTTAYQYDVLGSLLSVTLPDSTLVEYVVDGTGRRIAKKKDHMVVQKFLYAAEMNPVAELDGGDNVVSLFVYGVRANAPEYMVKGGQIYRIVTDHLGSVRLVVNTSTGAVAQRMDYDVFGHVLADTSPGFQPFGFAGGLYDADTGLVRFGARDYDPQTGRWTAKDPLRFAGSHLNFYAYASNDPVNFVDPLGLGPASGGPGSTGPFGGVRGGSLSEKDYWSFQIPLIAATAGIASMEGYYSSMSGEVTEVVNMFGSALEDFAFNADLISEQVSNLPNVDYGAEVVDISGAQSEAMALEKVTATTVEEAGSQLTTAEAVQSGTLGLLSNMAGVLLMSPILHDHPEILEGDFSSLQPTQYQ
jgi:RHS repeat-associated protein